MLINLFRQILPVMLMALSLTALPAASQTIDAFLGTYQGTAAFEEDGKQERRDMSAIIAESKNGFTISWTSVTHKSDGRTKEKTYTVEFLPSDRAHIFSSAMKSNVFGKQVPLDPLRGEPFVWARIVDKTLTLFSLYINEDGDYEMQEYHRTLVDGGLALVFRRLTNGDEVRTIETFLKRK